MIGALHQSALTITCSWAQEILDDGLVRRYNVYGIQLVGFFYFSTIRICRSVFYKREHGKAFGTYIEISHIPGKGGIYDIVYRGII